MNRYIPPTHPVNTVHTDLVPRGRTRGDLTKSSPCQMHFKEISIEERGMNDHPLHQASREHQLQQIHDNRPQHTQRSMNANHFPQSDGSPQATNPIDNRQIPTQAPNSRMQVLEKFISPSEIARIQKKDALRTQGSSTTCDFRATRHKPT